MTHRIALIAVLVLGLAGIAALSRPATAAAGSLVVAPSGLRVDASGDTATVSWNAEANATGYVVGIVDMQPPSAQLIEVPAGQTSAAFTLEPGGYFAYVRACAGSFCSAYAGPVRFTVSG